jgi:antirestriction protein ArdC
MDMTRQRTSSPGQGANVYTRVTERVIKMLESGVVPWWKTWKPSGQARNFVSGNVYRGINSVVLNALDYEVPYYLTYLQVKSLGGKLVNGAESYPVVYYQVTGEAGANQQGDTQDEVAGQDEAGQRRWFLRYHNVFNIADTTGIPYEASEHNQTRHASIQSCELILNGMKHPPSLSHQKGAQPSYSNFNDTVYMPPAREFELMEHYYSTLFHELVHSTGHRSRLNRFNGKSGVKGTTEEYAMEELVAELGACMLCTMCNVNREEVMQNTAAYLEGWLAILKQDHKFLFKASAFASRAVEHIVGAPP